VVLVIEGGHQFEVATFRQEADYVDGRHPESVFFSSPKEDAKRRDFTINGLFFDPVENRVLDFVGGCQDICDGIVRAIGDPFERFREDRLRMLRAVRFATRFDFVIEDKTSLAISKYASELFPAVSVERVWQEIEKIVHFSKFREACLEMESLGLLRVIFTRFKGDLKELLDKTLRFPKGTPPILYVLSLFPEDRLEESLNLCRFFKLSRHDEAWVCLYDRIRSLGDDKVMWAHFFAKEGAFLCLEVFSAVYNLGDDFVKEAHVLYRTLFLHVERIRKKRPLVTSHHLARVGIVPGKKMGKLLRLAECIAIERDAVDADKVIAILREMGEV